MIPVSKPSIQEDDVRIATAAIQSGWISSIGDYLKLFEKKFSEYINVPFCASCSNGTTALQLALSALNIGPGDEVIIPDFTFAAVANSVLAVGATPIFTDVDIKTWNITIENIRKNLTKSTKAVIVVHSYGNPVDVNKIKISFPNLKIIEDCAEAHGAKINGKMVGSLGDVSTFSFFGNKIITTGEGGAVLTNSPETFEKILILRDHGMDRNVKYHHVLPGFNYRMTNIQGAIGISQLSKIESFISDRDNQRKIYDMHLSELGFEDSTPVQNSSCVNWLYTRMVPTSINRDNLINFLKNEGIEVRPTFKPIHSFKYFKKNSEIFPNSEYLSSNGISLPTFNGITYNQQLYVISKISKYINSSK